MHKEAADGRPLYNDMEKGHLEKVQEVCFLKRDVKKALENLFLNITCDLDTTGFSTSLKNRWLLFP